MRARFMVNTPFQTSSTGEQLADQVKSVLASHLPKRHRQVPTRVFFSLLSLLFVAIGEVEPDSLIHKVNSVAGAASHLNSVLMAASAILMLADVIINDMMPARFRFFLDRRYRYLVLCTLGFTYVTYALLFVKAGYSVWTSTVYILLGVWAATIAVMDVVYEFKDGGACER